MNILFCSVPFRPSIGGIETVSALLAERFAEFGHDVVLVTRTDSAAPDGDSFAVVRRPSARRLFELVRSADIVLHNNISLRMAWPLLVLRKPWVVAHHTWLPQRGLAARAKRIAMRWATNIAVSRALAESLPQASTVVPNPYADDTFVPIAGIARRGELVYVGRLVGEKGVAVLIEALAVLRGQGTRVRLTIIGDGPQGPELRRQAAALGVDEQITFLGRRSGPELAASLNAHRVLVIPTVGDETFGIAALEALACGCVPLVSSSGGLPEAVGACGQVVARGSATALAEGIASLLADASTLKRFLSGSAAHLERHTRDHVARAYLAVIQDACRSHVPSAPARVA